MVAKKRDLMGVNRLKSDLRGTYGDMIGYQWDRYYWNTIDIDYNQYHLVTTNSFLWKISIEIKNGKIDRTTSIIYTLTGRHGMAQNMVNKMQRTRDAETFNMFSLKILAPLHTGGRFCCLVLG